MSGPASLGLRANLGQFALLLGVNALVGGMIGQERTVLPLLAGELFGLSGVASTLTFLFAFGITKAFANLVAGALADRYGRRPVLIAGWLFGVPVPILLILAPDWSWVVAANVLLGVNQGLAWSTTVLMKIDLVGPTRRGFAMGLNEASGYGAVAVTALATGWIAEAAGLRPAPFLLGLAFAGLGLAASVLFVRETTGHVAIEGASAPKRTGAGAAAAPRPPWREVFARTSWRDPSLSAASQAGLVNNLNDGMAWGLLPLFYAMAGLSIAEIGVLAAAYPAVWAVAQVGTGALSDRIGRKPLIVAGMLVQAAAIAGIAASTTFAAWLVAAAVLGLGTAMVYPTLLAAVADVAGPSWRGSAVGVYRLWRDLGFAAGAVVAGVVADLAGLATSILLVALLTALSGIVVLVRMRPGRPPRAGVARLRLVPSAELNTADVRAIRALLDVAFTGEDRFSDGDWEHALGGTHAVVEVDGAVVAHASVVGRTIEVGGRVLRSGHVEAVATAPDRQGAGHGTRVMQAIGAIVAADYELGTLGTGANRFYERLGWITWAGPTFVRMPDGSVVATPDDDGGVMVLRTPSTPTVDPTAPIVCDWRPDDVW